MRRYQWAVPSGAAEGRLERWLRSAKLASARDAAQPKGAAGRPPIRAATRLEPATRQLPRSKIRTNPIPARTSASRHPSTCWQRDTAPHRRANLGRAQSGTHQARQSRARDGGTAKSHDPCEWAIRRWTDRRCADSQDGMRNDARDASNNPGCCGAASARGRADWQPV